MTQLSCDYVRDVYPDVLNNKIDVLRAQQVRAHVASCDGCRGEAVIVESLQGLRVSAPGGMHERVLATAAAPERVGVSRRSLPIAAAVALALIGGSVLLQTRRATESGPPAEHNFGFVSVENAMMSGKASLNDWSEEDLELLLKEMES